MQSKDWTYQMSGGNEDFWELDNRPLILYSVMNAPTFCLCPEGLSEARLKSNGLINLAEEISRQPSIQTVVWLLLAAFSQVYSEN
jgi:hypothetical protein